MLYLELSKVHAKVDVAFHESKRAYFPHVIMYLFLLRSQSAVIDRGAGDLEPIPFSAYRHDVLIAVESRPCLYKLVHYLYHDQKVSALMNKRACF